MSLNPRLSAIITNYNHGEFLYESVGFLLKQSRKPDEIIIVDDGSVDHSRDVLELLKKEHPEIIVIFHERNQGVNAAVKTAIDRSTGNYLTTLGADDPLNPVFFERAMALHAMYPHIGLCSGEYQLKQVDTGITFRMSIKLSERPRGFTPAEMANIYRSRNQLSIPTAPAIWRRSAWDEVGGMQPELGWMSDWFAALVSISRHGFGFVPGIMQTVSDNPKSYSRSGMRAHDNHCKLLRHLFQTLAAPPYSDAQSFFKIHSVLSRFGFKVLNVILADKQNHSYLSPELIVTAIQAETVTFAWDIEQLKRLSHNALVELTSTFLTQSADKFLKIAAQLKREGRYRDALDMCSKAQDACPQNASSITMMSELYDLRERNNAALSRPQPILLST